MMSDDSSKKVEGMRVLENFKNQIIQWWIWEWIQQTAMFGGGDKGDKNDENNAWDAFLDDLLGNGE